MRHIFLLYFISFYINLSAQDAWKPQVFSAIKTPLDGGNISINRKLDFPIDKNGIAHLPSAQIKTGDSLFVSCLGYKTEIIVVKRIIELPTKIVLNPVTYQLEEVLVKKGKVRTMELNVGAGSLSISQYLTNFNTQYAAFINNKDKKKGYIKEIRIHMGNDAKGIDQPFRLRLYLKDPNSNFPSKELIEPIFTENKGKKSWFTIDISFMNLEMPEDGFFIAVETLSPKYYSQELVKIYSSPVHRLPGIKFTTFKKNYDKNNFSLIKLKDYEWRLYRGEFQMQARLLLIKQQTKPLLNQVNQ